MSQLRKIRKLARESLGVVASERGLRRLAAHEPEVRGDQAVELALNQCLIGIELCGEAADGMPVPGEPPDDADVEIVGPADDEILPQRLNEAELAVPVHERLDRRS